MQPLKKTDTLYFWQVAFEKSQHQPLFHTHTYCTYIMISRTPSVRLQTTCMCRHKKVARVVNIIIYVCIYIYVYNIYTQSGFKRKYKISLHFPTTMFIVIATWTLPDAALKKRLIVLVCSGFVCFWLLDPSPPPYTSTDTQARECVCVCVCVYVRGEEGGVGVGVGWRSRRLSERNPLAIRSVRRRTVSVQTGTFETSSSYFFPCYARHSFPIYYTTGGRGMKRHQKHQQPGKVR